MMASMDCGSGDSAPARSCFSFEVTPRKAQLEAMVYGVYLSNIYYDSSGTGHVNLFFSQCPLRVLTHCDSDLASVAIKRSVYGKIQSAEL